MTDENQPWWMHLSAVYLGIFSIEFIRKSLKNLFKDMYNEFEIPSLVSHSE